MEAGISDAISVSQVKPLGNGVRLLCRTGGGFGSDTQIRVLVGAFFGLTHLVVEVFEKVCITGGLSGLFPRRGGIGSV